MKSNVLLFDIETAPCVAYIWGLYKETTNMKFIKHDWYVLCWSAKWLGEKEIMSEGLYSKSRDDSKIMKKLWKLFDKADIVIAHNAAKFDVRKANARFIANGMKPPSPPKVVDTLKIARKHFAFTSNKLDDLGIKLDVGRKNKTGGFELWERCMDGDMIAWNRMVKYCEKDVKLLEKVYLKLRAYATPHPNLAIFNLGETRCSKCESLNLEKRGYAITITNRYQRFQCKNCGSWGRARVGTTKKDERKKLLVGV